MDEIVEKLLACFDPARRGLATGSMQVGIVPRLYVPLIDGAYLLKRGTSTDAIDQVVGAALAVAGVSSQTITEFAWTGRQPGTTYWYQVVPVGPGGVEAVVPASGEQLVQVRVDDGGEVEDPAPVAARELAVQVLAGGQFRVVWLGVQGVNRPAAASYAIFSDAGTGVMDWTTAIATVTAGGARMHAWESGAYAHGTTVAFGVRAIAASGATETNTTTVSATGDAQGPAAGSIDSAVIGEDE